MIKVGPNKTQKTKICFRNLFFSSKIEIHDIRIANMIDLEVELQKVDLIFEFFGTAPTNTLLQDVSPSARGKDLSEQFTRAFKTHLEEQMPYDEISDIRFHKLDGRVVSSFDTVFGDHRELLAVYGRWDGEDFQFFRAVVPVDGPYERSEEMALEAMYQMIRNCLNHEV